MKVGVVSLGCPKNLVDTELMLYILRGEGYELVEDSHEAEVIIINTCGFVEDAKQESIDTILEMSALKSENCRFLIVTGCLSQRYGKQLIKQMPEVDAILGVSHYAGIADVIRKLEEKQADFQSFSKAGDIEYLEGGRVITTGPGYAYLKIAEGCDNRCSYCAIPSIRGDYHSRKIDNIVEEARMIADSGINEIILVAQDSTRYGRDLYAKPMLPDLLEQLSGISGIKWIRSLYWYPDEIDDALIKAVAGLVKVCKYIDLPVQHASDRILGLMGRRGNTAFIEDMILKLRDSIDGLILRTSVILGFPTETINDFNHLMGFIGRMRFERLGAFVYSREEGTRAAALKPTVSKNTADNRLNRLMMFQKDISADFNRSRIGKLYKTKIDGPGIGRTFAETPEIDGQVIFKCQNEPEAGTFANVRITGSDEYDLYGDIENESA